MSTFTFIDLFAGIGGFRLGLTAAGGQPLFSNDWDRYSAVTYKAWYGDENFCNKDIREVDITNEIPAHDVLAGGFPCQPFSIAGVAKKNSLGRAHGFSDLDQGNLFFVICDIIANKKPKVVFLENVKNLIGHDKGKTWKVILESLELLGYETKFKVINASSWVPQNRRRVYIVAFNKQFFSKQSIESFQFPEVPNRVIKLGSILEKTKPEKKYMLTDNLWKYLQNYAKIQKAKGNGFGYKLYGPEDVTGTLSARYYKDGAEILIKQIGWRNPRKLTPAEAARLMGFNSKFARSLGFRSGFPQVVSDMQAYKQFGNSVCPQVVEFISKEIAKVIKFQSELNYIKTLKSIRKVS